MGTYNTLIAFADGSYLELIGFYRDNPDHRWWTALQRGGGLVDYCLQTDDLMGDTRAFRDAGVDIADPVSQSRVRPDGYQLRWVFSLARGPHRGVGPFLINDETPREERVPREQTHPNGVTGIGAVRIATGDLAAVSGWYTKATGQPGTAITSAETGGAGTRFMAGPHALEFLAPARAGRRASRSGWASAAPHPTTPPSRTRSGKSGPLDAKHTMGARLSLIGA